MRKLSVNESSRIKNTVGKNIAEIRKQKGMTQENLANKLDLDRVSVAYMETGQRLPRITTLYVIAQTLGVDIRNFLDGV